MHRERFAAYICSLPERLARSVSALAGGAVREFGEVALPRRVRSSRLYDSLVESTLRFLIENLGEVEGAYPAGAELPTDFLVRRAAGNVIEVAGVLSFSASPVWVLAALADLAGAGRDLISEIAEALGAAGLLESGHKFENVDQLLDGLERTAGRAAEAVNTPPLDVKALREEWRMLRLEAARMPGLPLPSPEHLWKQWSELKREAAAQERSVLELSSVMALSAVRKLPESARWLSAAARTGARRTGKILAHGLLDHYRTTLSEIREVGYLRYWLREFSPYLKASAKQFSPQRSTVTERFLAKRKRKSADR